MSLDLWHAEGGRRNPASTTAGGAPYVRAAAACMNFLQTVRISLERVAENIITCFSCGVLLKISCTSARMSSFSSILSHSSRMKCLTFLVTRS